jgi:hypothetical protein
MAHDYNSYTNEEIEEALREMGIQRPDQQYFDDLLRGYFYCIFLSYQQFVTDLFHVFRREQSRSQCTSS